MYIAIQLVMDLGHPGRGASGPPMHGLLHGAHASINHVLQLRHTSRLQSVPLVDAMHESNMLASSPNSTSDLDSTVVAQ